ncbi:MAG: DUF3299 domain-containing protein [Pseudomonadota bacterium]
MIRSSIFALALIVSACGGPSDEGAAPQSGTPATKTTQSASEQPRKSSETQYGDRIPEPKPSQRSAASNRLAALGQAELERDLSAYRELLWEELMPPGEEEKLAQIYQQQMMMLYSSGPIMEGSAADAMVQIGTFNTVPELNETKIRIPGYTVPFEYGSNAQITEFLLVPYYGACIHAPPPPPNQTIYVIAEEPIRLRDLAQAVWINGTIFTEIQESELADAAYTIRVDSVEIYEY